MKKKFLDSLQPQQRKDYQWNQWIKQQPKTKPYVDAGLANVMWGTEKDGKR